MIQQTEQSPTKEPQFAYQVAITRIIETTWACTELRTVALPQAAAAADAAKAAEALYARLIETARAVLNAAGVNTTVCLPNEAIALADAIEAATTPYNVIVHLMQGYGESFGTLEQARVYAELEAKEIDSSYERDDPICDGITCEHVDGTMWTMIEDNGLYRWEVVDLGPDRREKDA